MKYHFIAIGRDEWQVHKLNCKDVQKLQGKGNIVSIIIAQSPMHAIEHELTQLHNMGYDKDDFRIMPCLN